MLSVVLLNILKLKLNFYYVRFFRGEFFDLFDSWNKFGFTFRRGKMS